ncbi:hypothetical protein OIU34_23585 [Pararhizobium sp. BT-229]|uniref:hypothetical protein n=1 Tax=Pararhizobium sp. BT-229 TaxID=2986923 RepID=UPI0021F720C4|nr:hypothetical protein [Pararhizobium sp. BT-229]MCV9964879.1 hypothetical protein [Pararhizobium sp. BT-229]
MAAATVQCISIGYRWKTTRWHRSNQMIYTDETWTAHWDKAESILEEARFLRNAGFFDGAYIRALGSCLQAAMAVSLRLKRERDPTDYVPRLRQFFKDGRLPDTLSHPFAEIMNAHANELTTSLPRDADRAMEAIQLAETFQRAMSSAADLTASHYSPEVMQAAAARGISMPPAPFR